MYILDLTQPFGMLVALLVTVFCIALGKEFKKSYLPAVSLGIFLVLILVHTFQSIVLVDAYYKAIATKSLAIDAIMIFLSYFAYLWIDDIEAKEKNKKSVDNSLEWFWKKV